MVGMQTTLDMFVIQQHTIILIPICKDTIPVAANSGGEKIILKANNFLIYIIQKVNKTLLICFRTIN